MAEYNQPTDNNQDSNSQNIPPQGSQPVPPVNQAQQVPPPQQWNYQGMPPQQQGNQGQYFQPPVPPYPYNQTQPNGYSYQNYYRKSKLAAALLAFLFGSFGVHNFYLGFTTKAVIQLVLAIVGIFSSIFTLFIPLIVAFVWSFVEGVQIISNNEQYRYDANGIELIQ